MPSLTVEKPMHRREFLRSTSASVLAIGSAGYADCFVWPNNTPVRPFLLDFLQDEAEIVRIGITYQEMYGCERDTAHLKKKHIEDSPSYVDIGAVIAEDFAEGRTCTIRGWVLSVTEARQCADYALMRS